MEHIDIGYVVLHYLTDNDTVECVESIKTHSSGFKYKIVIVDNYSNNGSLERMKDRLSKCAEVHIVESKINLGFAQGNNLGIDYLRSRYDVDFVCLLNNDILLLQDNIYEKLINEFNQTRFAAAGPMIYTADGKCNDNPGRSDPITTDEVKKIISINQRNLFLCKWHLWKPYNLFNLILYRKSSTVQGSAQHKDYLNYAENIQLHGCFLVLSREFFSKFAGLYGGTFLYMEEEILFYLIRRAGLNTIYLPDIKVFHKEDAASKAAWTSDKKRAITKAEYVLDSAQHLLSIMEGRE